MLEVRQLDAFHGHAQALWQVDLDVADAEIVSVIGPNGAGKSTLVTAVAGLLRTVRGDISVDGTDLTTLPAHRVCSHGVAIVPPERVTGRRWHGWSGCSRGWPNGPGSRR
jgi:branched-chain amino acid transport system ATP-binding protein